MAATGETETKKAEETSTEVKLFLLLLWLVFSLTEKPTVQTWLGQKARPNGSRLFRF